MTQLKEALDKLIEQKLVRKKEYPTEGLSVYKYQNRVFFDNLWHKSPYLLKARGLVLDNAGEIAVHPFDKIFNFNENKTGADIQLSTPIIAVEKANGYLACISKHPSDPKQLLISTTGSLDSDFVGYTKDLITPDLNARLLKYFEHHNETLMFEAIHPLDPHIIEYAASEHGLWLIGARSKEVDSKLSSEETLDSIASELALRRPAYHRETFGEFLNRLKTEKIEGYVVRDAMTQEPILKGKTNYYLTTKFIGRMGKNNIEMMYKRPELFKEKIEEEFYELVDTLTQSTTKEQMLSMNNDDKIKMVRHLIETLNSQRSTDTPTKTLETIKKPSIAR